MQPPLRARRSRAAAISAPTAPPANTKPAHGNSVKIVNSPNGRMYHCSHSGSASTAGAIRTIGVTIAIAVAIAAYHATRAAAVRASPQTRPATAIAGPMMLRMSTRNSVTGWLPGVMMNPCRRKRKARMKISRPRRQIISTAARRLPVRSAVRVAASTTARPGEPEKQRRGEAAEHGRVAKRDRRCDRRAQTRPRVDGVRLDHQQHGDAARPVDVGAPMAGRHAWW